MLRNFGVESTSTHAAEASHQTWLEKFAHITETYNQSPLAQRLRSSLSLVHIARALKAMCGDHANAEKAQVTLMKTWKTSVLVQDLGERAILEKSLTEVITLLAHANERKVEAAGGSHAWEMLSEEDQALRNRQTVEETITELGKEMYESLSPEEKQEVDLFLWMGCCMHKSLNAFKGGNTEMMAAWETDLKGVSPPVLLANKANAAVLRRVLEPSRGNKPASEEELAAFEASTRGAAKTVTIAGAIFNHKDDKKGYHDVYLNFMQKYTRFPLPVRRFPGTSNTRFGSHGDAAEVLLVDLDAFRHFMVHIRDGKKSPEWTNIELNVHKALHCPRTLEELCVFAFYNQAVDSPYMQQVRGPDNEQINGLDLGPLHTHVITHIQKLIDHPDDFLQSNTINSAATTTLHGQPWINPLVIDTIYGHLHARNIPHFPHLLKAFLQGALTTWTRFSSEFASGGAIDLATPAERRQAWVPATNDANEGSLGTYRVTMRRYPNLTLLQYNALMMFSHNDTATFIEQNFIAEDHAFIMKEARRRDEMGLETARKARLLEDEERETARKVTQREAKQRKLDEQIARLASIQIITDLAAVTSLSSVRVIDDQIELHRALEAWIEEQKPTKERQCIIPRKSNCGNRSRREGILTDAIRRFLSRPLEFQMNIYKFRSAATGNNRTKETEQGVATDWEAEEDAETEEL